MPLIPSGRQLRKLASKPVALANELSMRPLTANPAAVVQRRSLRDAAEGKVIVITGASSGIGEATALRVGRAGAHVVLVARTKDKLDAVAAQVEASGGVADVRPCDLSDFEAIDATIDAVLAEHGRVDVLVNNAGRSIRRSVANSYDRFHDYERTMQLNYFAAVRLILRVLPGMRERQDGHVVNISSAGVQTRTPRFGAYIASKAALDTLCDALQAETRDEGVRFTAVHMPLVRTPMIAPTTIYKRFPALTPEEAGALVARAIVHRPRRVVPPFGHAAAFLDAISPDAMDIVRNRGYKMFPESSPDAATDRRGEAFARATSGTHW